MIPDLLEMLAKALTEVVDASHFVGVAEAIYEQADIPKRRDSDATPARLQAEVRTLVVDLGDLIRWAALVERLNRVPPKDEK